MVTNKLIYKKLPLIFVIVGFMLILLSASKNSNLAESKDKNNQNNSSVDSTINVITIGNQVWMTQNLNIDTFRNGDKIPEAKTVKEWQEYAQGDKPAWCYYENDAKNGEKYGKLYNWYAVNDPRGLAPIGWHVPSDQEWTILTDHLGGVEKASSKLKSKSGWFEEGHDGNNSSGFSALPGGNRYHGLGTFNLLGHWGYWWSSSEFNINDAWYRGMDCSNSVVLRYLDYKEDGFSVRCLKD
jgi:uncharacterized protein (TIGR02145 family)